MCCDFTGCLCFAAFICELNDNSSCSATFLIDHTFSVFLLLLLLMLFILM